MSESDPKTPSTNLRRRVLLKGVAAASGAMAFPYVHAQEKITLRYLGTAVNQDKAIAEKFKADTGITIQYIPVTTDDVTKRAVTAPNSFDLIDTEYFSLKKILPTGNLLGIDTKRIKNADKITTLFTKGEVAGKKVGDQGTYVQVSVTPVGDADNAWTVTLPDAEFDAAPVAPGDNVFVSWASAAAHALV